MLPAGHCPREARGGRSRSARSRDGGGGRGGGRWPRWRRWPRWPRAGEVLSPRNPRGQFAAPPGTRELCRRQEPAHISRSTAPPAAEGSSVGPFTGGASPRSSAGSGPEPQALYASLFLCFRCFLPFCYTRPLQGFCVVFPPRVLGQAGVQQPREGCAGSAPLPLPPLPGHCGVTGPTPSCEHDTAPFVVQQGVTRRHQSSQAPREETSGKGVQNATSFARSWALGISGFPGSRDRAGNQPPAQQEQLRAARTIILIASAASLRDHSAGAGSAPALLSEGIHLDTGISRGRSSKRKNAEGPAPGCIIPPEPPGVPETERTTLSTRSQAQERSERCLQVSGRRGEGAAQRSPGPGGTRGGTVSFWH
ncbi:uncharacterized protein LOC134547564 isoform X2 [Prinia subflava]|uniref:uncharacterized protein LOC134547564 isoform X2 n=1 Tax=Prinia subflava TaxID=208062 RepID=UPI002FDF19F8